MSQEKMHPQEKKELTQAMKRENNILHRLKELARKQEFGKCKCDILIKDGYIIEVRPEVFVGVIR